MSENPYWDKKEGSSPLDFKKLHDAVRKLAENQEKIKLPCGCIPQPGILLTCVSHSLIDEMES